MRRKIWQRASHDARWWDLTQRVAEVLVTSEDPSHPVETLLAGRGEWRAAEAGEQSIRLTFDKPQSVSRVYLRFVESDRERTQEFTLCWFDDDGRSFRELLRQQWNFSPHGSTEEVEDYQVNLEGASGIELTIRPGAREAIASLAEFKLA